MPVTSQCEETPLEANLAWSHQASRPFRSPVRLTRVRGFLDDLQQAHPSQRGPLSVSLELQADCFAGVWGHAAYDQGKVSRTEIADALDAAAAVGDDRIQRATRGRVSPETFTHGSSASRQKWFTVGMQTGDPVACDTFQASAR
jgi:predicted metalloprotease